MKLITLLILLSVFTISSCKDKKQPVTITEDTSFTAACTRSTSSLSCPEGNPVCSKPTASNELKVYCVDEFGILLSDAKCETTTSISYKPICKREEVEEVLKIQKNSSFKAICKGPEDTLSEVICSVKSTIPACGTIPGSTEVKAYCIDRNDIIINNSLLDCRRENERPTCEHLSSSS